MQKGVRTNTRSKIIYRNKWPVFYSDKYSIIMYETVCLYNKYSVK